MIDRGIIKWQPFNSLITQDKMIDEINKDKNKKEFPILSEDQIELISEEIKDAYYLKLNITLDYFYNGDIFQIKGQISNIFIGEKKICLKNKIIYFKQILKITY